MAIRLGSASLAVLLAQGAFLPSALVANPSPGQTPPLGSRTIHGGAGESVFDIASLASTRAAAGGSSAEARSDDTAERFSQAEKVKLSWSYQPLDEGPQFEVGAFGSHHDGTKKPIVHVGMDWAF